MKLGNLSTVLETVKEEEKHLNEDVWCDNIDADCEESWANDESTTLCNSVVERVGQAISLAAKDTPHEIEVNNCIVERLSSIKTEGVFRSKRPILQRWKTNYDDLRRW